MAKRTKNWKFWKRNWIHLKNPPTIPCIHRILLTQHLQQKRFDWLISFRPGSYIGPFHLKSIQGGGRTFSGLIFFLKICGNSMEKGPNSHIPPGKKISKSLGKFLLYTLSCGVDELKSVFHPLETSELRSNPLENPFCPLDIQNLCSAPWKITRIIILPSGKKKYKWAKAPGNFSSFSEYLRIPLEKFVHPLYGYKMEHPISLEKKRAIMIYSIFFLFYSSGKVKRRSVSSSHDPPQEQPGNGSLFVYFSCPS